MTESVELIYDRLIAEEKLKTGTKYEKLAAIVFRLLSGSATVHDLRLRGEVGVPHQIDVVVGEDRRRVLIEVKDYDRKVDLPVVRAFTAVVEDLKPAEAFVVTGVGFTPNAIAWAEAKGLTLAVLRPPNGDEDWGNFVRRIDVALTIVLPLEPEVNWHIHESEVARFEGAVTPFGTRSVDDILVRVESRPRRTFREFLEPQLQSPQSESSESGERVTRGKLEFAERTWLELPGESPILVTGFSWSQKWIETKDQFSVGDGVGGLAAELVLRSIDGSIHRLFTNKQIQAWTFQEGLVVPRDE